VKKEKVRAIEESLIAAATTGKLAGRVIACTDAVQ
jgi:hypothetical protein